MKKMLLALFVAASMIGCNNNPAPQPTPTPAPSVVRESDNGKLFTVSKGSQLTVELNQGLNNDFFWSVDGANTVGGLTVISESEVGGVVRFVIQADSPGALTLQYIQFTDVGGKVLKTFLLKVEVK